MFYIKIILFKKYPKLFQFLTLIEMVPSIALVPNKILIDIILCQGSINVLSICFLSSPVYSLYCHAPTDHIHQYRRPIIPETLSNWRIKFGVCISAAQDALGQQFVAKFKCIPPVVASHKTGGLLKQ